MNDFFGIVRKFLLEYLPLQRRLSENTVKSYRQGLNLYVSYLREVMQIPTNRIAFKDCTRDSVLGYLDWLGTERGCGATAYGINIAAVPTRKARGREVNWDFWVNVYRNNTVGYMFSYYIKIRPQIKQKKFSVSVL